jgi:hypothetical protein
MKNIFFLLLIFTLIISCKSNNKQPVKDSAVATPVKGNSIDLVAKFKPIIQGLWVKSAYLDKVINTKSPAAAADEAIEITAFYIDTEKIEGDNLNIVAGYGNHDSGDLHLKFKSGTKPETLSIGEADEGYDLGYEIKKRDTTLILSYFNNKKHTYTPTSYKRVINKQPDNDLGYGMYRYINKRLVAGNYTLYDSTSAASKVSFSTDGKVNGFLSYKTYNINIDLNSDAMDNLDEIGFDSFSKDRKSYSFKIDVDTLKLYDTRPNADSTLLVLDKLKYRLVRVK